MVKLKHEVLLKKNKNHRKLNGTPNEGSKTFWGHRLLLNITDILENEINNKLPFQKSKNGTHNIQWNRGPKQSPR
jgi:hypothetical protein